MRNDDIVFSDNFKLHPSSGDTISAILRHCIMYCRIPVKENSQNLWKLTIKALKNILVYLNLKMITYRYSIHNIDYRTTTR